MFSLGIRINETANRRTDFSVRQCFPIYGCPSVCSFCFMDVPVFSLCTSVLSNLWMSQCLVVVGCNSKFLGIRINETANRRSDFSVRQCFPIYGCPSVWLWMSQCFCGVCIPVFVCQCFPIYGCPSVWFCQCFPIYGCPSVWFMDVPVFSIWLCFSLLWMSRCFLPVFYPGVFYPGVFYPGVFYSKFLGIRINETANRRTDFSVRQCFPIYGCPSVFLPVFSTGVFFWCVFFLCFFLWMSQCFLFSVVLWMSRYFFFMDVPVFSFYGCPGVFFCFFSGVFLCFCFMDVPVFSFPGVFFCFFFFRCFFVFLFYGCPGVFWMSRCFFPVFFLWMSRCFFFIPVSRCFTVYGCPGVFSFMDVPVFSVFLPVFFIHSSYSSVFCSS